jgi:hypothetical protein
MQITPMRNGFKENRNPDPLNVNQLKEPPCANVNGLHGHIWRGDSS